MRRDIHVPLYTAAQAADAAGITADTLKNWVSRDPKVVLLTDEERTRKNNMLFFSGNRVMQIALVADLVVLGCTPRKAALAAAAFTDLGESPREPGELFHAGETWLVVPPTQTDENVAAWCVNVSAATKAGEILISQADGKFYHSGLVLRVDAIHRRLMSKLDSFTLHPKVAG